MFPSCSSSLLPHLSVITLTRSFALSIAADIIQKSALSCDRARQTNSSEGYNDSYKRFNLPKKLVEAVHLSWHRTRLGNPEERVSGGTSVRGTGVRHPFLSCSERRAVRPILPLTLTLNETVSGTVFRPR